MRGETSILISALLMSTVSIFVRNIEGDAVSITFLRFSSALLFLTIFSILSKEFPAVRDRSLIYLGIVNVSTVVCYISAIQTVQVGTAALLLYMAPVYVLPIAAVTGERIERKTWIAVPLGITGLYLMLSPYAEISLGLVLGVLSGVSYAFVFFYSKRARMKHSSFQITFFNLAFGSAILLPYFLFRGVSGSLPWILGLGLVPTAIPFVLFAYGIKYVKVQRAPILALVEPLSATFIGYIYFSEILTAKQIMGAMLIFASIIIAWRK